MLFKSVLVLYSYSHLILLIYMYTLYLILFVNFFLNLSFSDFCDFESEPETSCFLTEELSTDNGDWTRGTVSMTD